ncbi:OmpA family protein [Pseudooceanicola sp. 502str34]|uniref:OmpA family protein n=1 Tax=Maritimibacter alkaliphilus TaxID=404236 RepID=UPI0021BCFEFF|nr:OmpA family protein [Maritimibacter alkaliphilus]
MIALNTLALPAGAQDDLSVDELKSIFERQKQAFSEAETNGLGLTRGLKLVTVDNVTAESAAGDETAAGAEPQVTSTAPALSAPAGTSGQTAGQGVSITAQGDSRPVRPSDPNKPLLAAATDQPMVFGQLAPELQVNLHIEFGFDSAAISDDQKPKLKTVCMALQAADIGKVRIVGHTDSSGSEAYNERLSVLRAKEVARNLIEGCGLPASRLETVGMGERFPYNADDPRAEENRRVEFQALS